MPLNTAPAASGELLVENVEFDVNGLVPVIAQDVETGVVRMLAWANREALVQTLQTGAAVFWSRSRRAVWRKGETSGNTLWVREIRVDCDGDAVLYLVDADGPSCHTEHTSCFYRHTPVEGLAPAPPAHAAAGEDAAAAALAPGALAEDDAPPDPPAVVVSRVANVIARRRRERPDRSYVVSLLDAGWPKILEKIREESEELGEALPAGDAAHTAHEAADLLFHVLVGLEAAGVPVNSVFDQLRRRFGVSGLDEKARREPAGPKT
jgi:phosphoribosyl-ATP pyrophosphohydrolase/phosphoribosyl-AMP cyclohydrolase